MSTESREHLSCLMDGEISRETGRFLVRRLGSDEELSATWARYHLVRDCLRQQEGGYAALGLSGRVRRAIDDEAAGKPAAARAISWLKPAAGLAVAASVALLAIVAVGPGGQNLQGPGENPAAETLAESFTSPQALTPPPPTQQASLAGQTGGENRMNAYLLRHYQATGSTGGKGFVTFVPIVIRAATVQAESSEPTDGSSPEDNPGESTER
jgi:sigma-E factor negative regulatory protein RseA